jgi:hypothetical protein
MLLPDPVDTTCPRCTAASRHKLADWLTLTVNCPACGSSLADVASKTKAMVDEWNAIVTWAEVSVEVEARLGIDKPGIEDGPWSGTKAVELTLSDLASLVAAQFPEKVTAESDAIRHVHEAAEKVIRRQLSRADFDRPLIQLLRLPK